jgi:D-serine deaminase-like pyridoxal phosphate-dependent protein
MVDAGRKAVDPSARPPVPRGLAGVVGIDLSAEHGRIRLDGPATAPRVGERLELEIGYHDQAVHLHEVLHAVRDGVVEAVWPVAARGRLA